MTLTEWAIIVGISGSVLTAIRFMVKYYLHELVPNSGSSLKDQITRIELHQTKQDEKIDRILFLMAGEE